MLRWIKKNPSNSRFSTTLFFTGETENKIKFDINTEKQFEFEQF
jgi:hypothetical protein